MLQGHDYLQKGLQSWLEEVSCSREFVLHLVQRKDFMIVLVIWFLFQKFHNYAKFIVKSYIKTSTCLVGSVITVIKLQRYVSMLVQNDKLMHFINIKKAKSNVSLSQVCYIQHIPRCWGVFPIINKKTKQNKTKNKAKQNTPLSKMNFSNTLLCKLYILLTHLRYRRKNKRESSL